MIHSQAIAPDAALLADDTIQETLVRGLAGRSPDAKSLLLIPDHTRSIPLQQLFRLLVDILADARQLDFMVALGAHPAPSKAELYRPAGITPEERQSTYAHIGPFNHAWDSPEALTTIATLPQAQLRKSSGSVGIHPWPPPAI